MRLFLFTPPTTLPNEHAALHSLAARAKSTATTSDGGGFLPAALHVRKPGADEASVEAYLKKLPRSLLERAVLHSHHALAGKFDVQVGDFKIVIEKRAWTREREGGCERASGH
jgi:hypothetical protein